MSKLAEGLVRERVHPHVPEIVPAIAAMLIAIAATGCSTLMEPDHADAALTEFEFGPVGHPSLPRLKCDRQNSATAVGGEHLR